MLENFRRGLEIGSEERGAGKVGCVPRSRVWRQGGFPGALLGNQMEPRSCRCLNLCVVDKDGGWEGSAGKSMDGKEKVRRT